jgi:hypothetical protein
MKNMRFLPFALFLLSAILFSSCKSEVKKSQICIGEPGTGAAGTKCSEIDDEKQSNNSIPSPVASSSPVVSDMICFKDNSLAAWGVRCDPEQIHKIPRGTKVTVSLKTTNSVQQGNQTQAHFEANTSNSVLITVPEMESLATQGAKIYAITYTTEDSKKATQIYYFDQSSDGFKLRFQGALEAASGETSKVVFTAGDISQNSSSNSNPSSTTASTSTAITLPDNLVRSYFTNIQSGQYQKAWDMLPSDLQRNKSTHPDGYKSFTDWWQKTSVDVDAIKVASKSDQDAIVDADVRYKTRKGSPQPLHLRYFLRRSSSTDNWVITNIKSK